MKRHHRWFAVAAAVAALALSASQALAVVGPGDVYAEWNFGSDFGGGQLFADQASDAGSVMSLSAGADAVYSVIDDTMYGNPRKMLYGSGTTSTGIYLSVTVPDVEPTAGYSYVNAYTLVWNVWLPSGNPNGLGNWMGLYNSNETNANIAEIFVHSGTGGLGHNNYAGNAGFDTWTQYALTVAPDPGDVNTLLVSGYINGAPLGTINTPSRNAEGRYALYSNNDAPIPTLLLFADNEGANYNDDVYMSSFAFVGRALSDAEIAGLVDGGQPKSDGILNVVPEPSSVVLALVGAGACGLMMRRKKVE